MADINNRAQETEIVDETTGYKLTPNSDGSLTSKVSDGTYVAGVDATNHLLAAGKAAPGSAPTSNPVSVSGIDVLGLKRALLTDGAGRLQVGIIPSSTNKPVQIVFDQAHSAINTGEWQEVLNFTVPVGYDLNAISFDGMSSTANERARAVLKTVLGSYNSATNTFIDGGVITAPQYAPKLYVLVTTAIGAGANDTVTITYTNGLNQTGRTGTVTIPKSALVGTRLQVTLQAGDFSVRDITAVTHTATGQAGAFEIEAVDGLFFLALTSSNTLYQSASVSLGGAIVLEGRTVTLQYFSATAVPNVRRINLMATLVPRV